MLDGCGDRGCIQAKRTENVSMMSIAVRRDGAQLTFRSGSNYF